MSGSTQTARENKIVELASTIAENTSKVAAFLTSKGLPLPSFEKNGPSRSLIPQDAQDIEAARVAVIEATQQLRLLMLGPLDYLTSFTHDELISMQAISRFNIASTVPVEGEATFAEIAEACGLSELDAKRIVRHAVVKDLFIEPRPGFIAHNAVSRLLRDNAVLNDWVGASSDELWQAAAQTVNAMVKFPNSEEPTETGFAVANRTDKSMYQELEQHPERARRFGSAMTLFTEGEAFHPRHLLNGYPWHEVQNGTVVDLGGSHGAICKALASAHSNMHFVIQDLASVVESAPMLSNDAAKQISFQVHDFLTPQPLKNADVYLLRWILHNWSDAYAINILRNLIPALKPGARIVVNDNVLPPPGVLPKWREERLRSMDLTMKEIQNSREREMEDWRKLFEVADSRFDFRGGSQPKGSMLWILEAIWRP